MSCPHGHGSFSAGCAYCERTLVEPRYLRLFFGGGPILQKPTVAQAPARSWCRLLGPRTEERAGCSGWMCRHDCTSNRADVLAHLGGIPSTVPGGDCQTCPGWEARDGQSDPIIVDQGATGLGDAILGLCAVAGLKQRSPGRHVVYRVSSGSLPWIELFEGYDSLDPHAADHSEAPVPGARAMNIGYSEENRTRCARPRIRRYLDNIGQPTAVLPRLRNIHRARELGSEFAGVVLLAPFSHFTDREYHVARWQELIALLKAKRYTPVVLHHEPTRAALLDCRKLIGAPPEAVMGAMLNAGALVGNDSGLAHVAGALGTPTVALCGPTNGRGIFDFYPSVAVLEGDWPCSGCHWNPPDFDGGKCGGRCPSLQTITADRILAELDGHLLTPLTQGRSLLNSQKLVVLRDEVLATNHLDGDLAEFGVCCGGSALVLAHFAEPASIHLFDTFQGLPHDDPHGVHRRGEFLSDEQDVRRALNDPRFVFHVGEFRGTEDLDLRFRFAHVDVDTYASTKAAIEWLRPRMVPGGRILVDDLEWANTPGVTAALKEVAPTYRRPSPHQALVEFRPRIELPTVGGRYRG